MPPETPPFLFTVISLVIAISGATYTALVAMRSYLHDEVKKIGDSAEQCHKALAELKKPCDHKAKALEKYGWLEWWKKLWHRCFVVPIVIFSLVIFPLAFYSVCQNITNHISTVAWLSFRWLIASLSVIDIMCIAFGWIAYMRMNYNLRDLVFDTEQAVKAQLGGDPPGASARST